MDFKTWMAKVSDEIESKVGLSLDDLPDMNYYEMWEDGISPANAARKAIRNAKE